MAQHTRGRRRRAELVAAVAGLTAVAALAVLAVALVADRVCPGAGWEAVIWPAIIVLVVSGATSATAGHLTGRHTGGGGR
ncbi:hypothetical protein [Verrucosispora sp. WMMC514]|uniref:hypothetical protein n=1 Tax=Verrucosispora sp. WMMC514 TaxID=3015156 RepID=UPI00248C4F9A|nr:hypothetical protein [Verrucosispora sp. WMMC514]WBB94125.1 hypothetical protein O7597_14850 [Verrucosispora sp. WMMC514]